MSEIDAPLLSVMVPFHADQDADRRSMIVKLVETIPDIATVEIVVIEDHSPLACPQISRSTRPISIGSTSDGVRFAGSARNAALALARGTFGLFADSDDLFAEGAIERVLQDIVQTKDSASPRRVRLLEPREFSDSEPGALRALYQRQIASTDPDNARRLCGWHSPWGKVYNIEAAKVAGVRFDDNLRVANDVLFSTRLALFADEVSTVTGATYLVRRAHSAGALTALSDPASIASRIATQRRMNEFLTAEGRGDIAVPMHHIFRRYFRTHPRLVIAELLRSLGRSDPILPNALRLGART